MRPIAFIVPDAQRPDAPHAPAAAADAQTNITVPPGSPKNLEDIRLHLAVLRGTKKTK